LGVTAYGTAVHVVADDIKKVEEEIRQVSSRENVSITSIKTIHASLEDVFATLTEVKP
jgi:hypothetical protein